jgi:hypothetical protein
MKQAQRTLVFIDLAQGDGFRTPGSAVTRFERYVVYTVLRIDEYHDTDLHASLDEHYNRSESGW